MMFLLANARLAQFLVLLENVQPTFEKGRLFFIMSWKSKSLGKVQYSFPEPTTCGLFNNHIGRLNGDDTKVDGQFYLPYISEEHDDDKMEVL